MTRRARYDVVIVGGGFFGCSLASQLGAGGRRVLLVEERPGLLERASYHNQARVHRGYHYPRSVLTAWRSAANFPRWIEAYRNCIVDDFGQYYAIARRGSKVSARQFARFMERVGAPLAPAPAGVEKLFHPGLIEQVFTVREYAFDAVRLRVLVTEALEQAQVEVATLLRARRVAAADGGGVAVELMAVGVEGDCGRPDAVTRVEAGEVFNCTYSRINELLAASDLPCLRLKHELAEMALVEVPPELEKTGVTVMCGPFFSLMPFPPRGLHTFSHVRYTPHGSWEDTPGGRPRPDGLRGGARPPTHFRHMQADAQRYLPALAGLRQVDSLWEIKTVLPQSEEDDSRPILLRRDCGLPNLHCVMGAKIDNIFDVLAECGRSHPVS